MRNVLVALLPLMLAGCFLELLGTTAIQGELEAQNAASALRTLEYVREQTGQTNAQHAIDLFYADTGYYPASLEGLVPDYLPSVPVKPDGTAYEYDPDTGTLLWDAPMAPLPRGPQGPNAADGEQLHLFRRAIAQYTQDNQQYPTSLWALVPEYLGDVPAASSGQDFLYDRETGFVYHPSAFETPQAPRQPLAASPRQRRRAPIGAGGPMGEMMTGIAIQEELNSMSSAGSSAAGSRARHNVRNFGDQQTDRQNRAMDELGL